MKYMQICFGRKSIDQQITLQCKKKVEKEDDLSPYNFIMRYDRACLKRLCGTLKADYHCHKRMDQWIP